MEDASTKPAPTPGKRARSKAANRRAILDAARSVFARIGVDSTTIRDIIRETDLAAGTFYNYFKSKEEVCQALSDDSLTRFRPLLESVRREADDLETYIWGAYHAFFQFLEEENADAIHAGAPHMALIGVRIDTPEMKSVVAEVRADLERYLAKANAEVADAEYAAAAAVGVAREIGDYMLQRRPVDVEGATSFAANMFLAGIGKTGHKTNA